MAWPEIFWSKAKKRPDPAAPPPFKAPETRNTTPEPPAPPPSKAATAKLPKVDQPKVELPDTGMPTFPATHGVVLRPPASIITPLVKPGGTGEPIKNIEQLMAEADPVRTLSQTGSVRMLKRLTPDPTAPKPVTPTESPMFKPAPTALTSPPPAVESPWPAFQPKTETKPEVKAEMQLPPVVIETRPEPVVISTPPPVPLVEANKPDEDDSPFILKPEVPAESTPPIAVEPQITPPVASTATSMLGAIFRRKTKMADIARIVLPPRREETVPLPMPPESSPTVVPSAFPVVDMTRRVEAAPAAPELSKAVSNSPNESPFLTKSAASEAAANISVTPTVVPLPTEAEAPKPVDPMSPMPSAPPPFGDQKPAEPMSLFPDPPKVDPEAHKSAPADIAAPKVDPEAHRPPPSPAPPALSVPTESRSQEKREFHLTNGEHVAGVVLSETPEAVYVEHATLGVITVPRGEIAKRLVEIILTNGDRIVGDIMAETADMLYVRHSALGMLSVPRAHRSTRVVEAILKDGDRILGEVLTETDSFTVIRSATLGTITVPHNKLAMLNRKIEQIEMKALPSTPELKDKAS